MDGRKNAHPKKLLFVPPHLLQSLLDLYPSDSKSSLRSKTVYLFSHNYDIFEIFLFTVLNAKFK